MSGVDNALFLISDYIGVFTCENLTIHLLTYFLCIYYTFRKCFERYKNILNKMQSFPFIKHILNSLFSVEQINKIFFTYSSRPSFFMYTHINMPVSILKHIYPNHTHMIICTRLTKDKCAYLFQFGSQQIHVCSLKSGMMRIFALQELANATNQSFFSS